MEKAFSNRESLEGVLYESQQLLDNRQSAMAADKLMRLVRAIPPHGPLYEVACVRLSAAYQQQGKLKKAISMLRQAIKQAPKNAGYRLNLAHLYKSNNDEERALSEARRAIRLAPGLLEARELVAELLLEQGLAEGTIKEANEILKRSPRNLRALDLLGMAFLCQGNIENALKVVNRMVTLCPSEPVHHFKKGILLQQQGQIGEALKSFLRVVDLAGETDLGLQAAGAVQMLDDYQVRQILLLATEDAMFHYRLGQDAETAAKLRGFYLSPTGLAVLQIEFMEETPQLTERGYHYLN